MINKRINTANPSCINKEKKKKSYKYLPLRHRFDTFTARRLTTIKLKWTENNIDEFLRNNLQTIDKKAPHKTTYKPTHTHVLYNCETFEAKLLQKQTSVISTNTKKNHRQTEQNNCKSYIKIIYLSVCLYVMTKKTDGCHVANATAKQ